MTTPDGDPPPSSGSGSQLRLDTAGLPQLVRILGAIAAPTTLLTALLYYFGWNHTERFFNEFGVDSTVLGFTAEDYLIRSLDALFVPMVAVAAAGLLLVWCHALARIRLTERARTRMTRILQPVTTVCGLALTGIGLSKVFGSTVLDKYLVVAPLSLASGVLALAYAIHLQRSLGHSRARSGWTGGLPVRVIRRRTRGKGTTGAGTPDAGKTGAGERNPGNEPARRKARTGRTPVAEWAIVFILVGLSLFWAATDYSAAVGRSRARQFAAALPEYPNAVVYSASDLNLDVPGVSETRSRDPKSGYAFRYDGLKLVLQAENQYLFLPQTWTPDDGVALLLPRSDSLRLEFRPAPRRLPELRERPRAG
jgi:hypothetical protein